MRKIGILLLGLTLISVANAELLNQVKARGTLRVALEGTYPPFNYREGNKLVGFDVDVAAALAKQMGVKVEYVTIEFSGIIAGLQANKYDIIVNQVAITPARLKVLDFSTPYVRSSAQLIQKKGDSRKFNTLEDLKGKRLGVGLGSNYADQAKAVGGITLKTYAAAADTLSDLAAGRIDAALNDSLILAYLTQKTRLPVQSGARVGTVIKMGIPFKKNNPKFKAALNKALTSLQKSGEYAKIGKKWFGMDVSK